MGLIIRGSTAILLAAALAAPVAIQAAGIANGDFGTGDFSGWSLDTDGFPGSSNDFNVVGSPGPYRARVEADYWDPPGDIFGTPLNDVFFANTLFQGLDTTAGPGEALILSFDWDFGGEDGDSAAGEVFLVGLNDGLGNLFGAEGNLGFLVGPTAEYGSGNFSVNLDGATFANMPGWFLDFQLQVGVDPVTFEPNGLGSFVEIDNVALVAQSAAVPSAGTFALILAGMLSYLPLRWHRFGPPASHPARS